jgi:hypothetical protein
VEERQADRQLTLEEARPQILEALLKDEPDAERRRYGEFLDELRARYPVEITVEPEWLGGLR